MSTFFTTKKKCAVCGTKNEFKVCGSTHSFGYCDLDFRPAEQKRSLLYLQVEECKKCGFIWTDIEDRDCSKTYKKIMESDFYRNCDGIKFKSVLAEKFYKMFLLSKCFNESNEVCFYLLRSAVWASDDAKDRESALKCRIESLKYLEKLISLKDKNIEKYILIKIDFLRRCNKFDVVINSYDDFKFSKREFDKAFKYEKILASNNDCQAHRYDECLGL